MTKLEKIAEILCNELEYAFIFSDLSEGGFIRNKYINAAQAVLDYQRGNGNAETDSVRVTYYDVVDGIVTRRRDS